MALLVSGGRPPQTPRFRGDPSPWTPLGGGDPPEAPAHGGASRPPVPSGPPGPPWGIAPACGQED
jgi:hypothetical protein